MLEPVRVIPGGKGKDLEDKAITGAQSRARNNPRRGAVPGKNNKRRGAVAVYAQTDAAGLEIMSRLLTQSRAGSEFLRRTG